LGLNKMKTSLIIGLLLFGTLTCAAEYVYTVKVDVSDPRESPITVSLNWPDGSKTNTLAKRGMVSSTRITWPESAAAQGTTIPSSRIFNLTVEISKSNHFTWRKIYDNRDFVPMADGDIHIVDRVTLSRKPKLGTPEQLEALSQSLPLGLSPYSEVSLSDRDKDGVPDSAWLTRTTSDSVSPYQGPRRSPSHSADEEIRQMRLQDGQWRCVFLANHLGVFVAGKKVDGTPAAPFGYRISARTGGGGLIFDDLYAIDPSRRRSPQISRSYFWPRGRDTIEVIVFDRNKADSLQAYLKHPNTLVRMRTARLLRSARYLPAVKPLIDALADEGPYTGPIISEALETLTGQHFGQDQDKWNKWYEDSQQSVPQL
jgi:hypothetical protein